MEVLQSLLTLAPPWPVWLLVVFAVCPRVFLAGIRKSLIEARGIVVAWRGLRDEFRGDHLAPAADQSSRKALGKKATRHKKK